MRETLALDRASFRRTDQDGHLHVEESRLSRATVSPYLGIEIPDYKSHGLDPNKVYSLLRDPKELRKAASTLDGKPLLSVHRPQTSDDHQHKIVVGSVNNCVFDGEWLKGELTIWSAEAIAGVEDGSQKALSCGYRYEFDPAPGTFNGQSYDGRMKSIYFNHVALVNDPRVKGAMVGDSAKLFNSAVDRKRITMSKRTRSHKALLASDALLKRLKLKMAGDADLSDLSEVIEKLDDALARIMHRVSFRALVWMPGAMSHARFESVRQARR